MAFGDSFDKPTWAAIAIISFNVGMWAAWSLMLFEWLQYERETIDRIQDEMAVVRATQEDRQRVVEDVRVLQDQMEEINRIAPRVFRTLQGRP